MKRKIVNDPLCLICGAEPETLYHILWACPSAMDAWGASCRKFQKSSYQGRAFIQMVEEIVYHGSEEEK